MKNKKITEEKQSDKPKRSFISIFFGKRDPDEAYMSDLKLEWQNLDQKERIKFVLGAVFGFIIFISALIMVYIFLSSMMR